MTWGLDTATAAAATANVVRPRWFCDLDFASGFVRKCTGYVDLAWDVDGDGSDETFDAVGDIGGITAIDEATDLRARSVTLTMTGIKASYVSIALSEHYQGRRGRLFKGFVDATDALVADPKCRFIGVMDVMSYRIEGGIATLSMKLVNRYARWEYGLDQPRYSNEDHQADHPDDKFFEFLAQNAKGTELIWGKG